MQSCYLPEVTIQADFKPRVSDSRVNLKNPTPLPTLALSDSLKYLISTLMDAKARRVANAGELSFS